MSIEVLPGARGRSLLLDGFAQSDVDMNHFKLLNLDTSNLPPMGIPPTVHPPVNKWLHDWDVTTLTWTATQPAFGHILGNLTPAQQSAITQVGLITSGIWQGSVINPQFLPHLNELQVPVGDVSANNHKITGLADPVNAQDAVNKRFMDMLLQGLNPKEQCRIATTGSVFFIGQPVIDGIQTAVGDRILVKNETGVRQSENGIYIITASGIWTRSPDTDIAEELERAFVFIRLGNVNGSTKWVQVGAVTFPFSWILFSSGSEGGEPGPPGPPGPGVPDGGNTGDVLAKIDEQPYNTHWVPPDFAGVPDYSIVQTATVNPVGTTNATGRMMGLAGYITPLTSGKVVTTIAGYIFNTSAAGAAATRLCVGTGTAPVNGQAQPVGSFLVGAAEAVGAIGASKVVPFSVSVVLSSLTVGIPVWYDLLLQALTTGTATVGGVSVTAFEIP